MNATVRGRSSATIATPRNARCRKSTSRVPGKINVVGGNICAAIGYLGKRRSYRKGTCKKENQCDRRFSVACFTGCIDKMPYWSGKMIHVWAVLIFIIHKIFRNSYTHLSRERFIFHPTMSDFDCFFITDRGLFS